MLFKSEAQRRKFAELVQQGKMKQSTFDEWNNATTEKLPERIKPKKIKSTDDLRQVAKEQPWNNPFKKK